MELGHIECAKLVQHLRGLMLIDRNQSFCSFPKSLAQADDLSEDSLRILCPFRM